MKDAIRHGRRERRDDAPGRLARVLAVIGVALIGVGVTGAA